MDLFVSSSEEFAKHGDSEEMKKEEFTIGDLHTYASIA